MHEPSIRLIPLPLRRALGLSLAADREAYRTALTAFYEAWSADPGTDSDAVRAAADALTATTARLPLQVRVRIDDETFPRARAS